MKVTNHGLKGRQLQKEDYWQKAAAEQQGYAGVPIHVRIAENNNIIADLHKQECGVCQVLCVNFSAKLEFF